MISLTYSVTDLETTTVAITDCIPHWNGSHFDFTIHWTVKEFVAYGNEIFSGFLVVVEDRIAKRFIRGNDVRKIANQTEYSYKWFHLPPLEQDTTYQFRVKNFTMFIHACILLFPFLISQL